MHIFYPFSRFFYPDTFPGTDPNDCPRDISKEKAIESGCNNALHPDKYGHYREDRYVQLKHHWFWKLQYTFKRILGTDQTDGKTDHDVILLEDDYYVTKDILTSFKKLKSQQITDIISLGNYDLKTNTIASSWKATNNLYDTMPFYGSQNNMGLALNRKFFDKLEKCKEEFCKYDDYNWDWSLNSMVGTASTKCLGNFRTTQFSSPRVLHLGACTGAGGTHLNKKGLKQCDLPLIKQKADKFSEDIFSGGIEEFDNLVLKLRKDTKIFKKAVNPNGGFSDPRDHALCLDYNLG